MFFTIILSLIILFIVLGIISVQLKKKKSQIKNVKIEFDDVQSLNVSKIVIEENDIDFIRNEFWFKYKQKQKLDASTFYFLKKHFEQKNQVKINDLLSNLEEKNIDTLTLVDIIISDCKDINEVALAFYLLEKRMNS